MLQEGRKFGKADSTLADFQMFVFDAMVVVQMNMLQAWPKGLNAGLNTAIDVGMPGIQGAHHGRMSDRLDEPEMIGKRGNDLVWMQLYVFNADPYAAIAGDGGASSQGIDGKLEGFLAQGLLRDGGMVRRWDDLTHVRHHHITPQFGCKADCRLQLLDEALAPRGHRAPQN